ncbi:Uncharacterised protein [uncultured Eubacterium sp.]|uniref:hypothetical protein n=1 Tax=Emergencia sp. TaxID=1926557 RepID=UPI0008232C9C|nr:Uncharacterised protein [uncultured Eubacterium sp.]
MDREELFALLDIETGEDFQYFENFADFVENEGAIDSDAIYDLITEIDMKTFAELCESYFYETLENVPGDQIDIYSLLENIKRVLVGLSEAVRKGEENADLKLTDEWNKFRIWYSADSEVECKNTASDEVHYVPVRDALVISRMEKLDGDEYRYDFAGALDYELEEFIMNYADMAEAEND